MSTTASLESNPLRGESRGVATLGTSSHWGQANANGLRIPETYPFRIIFSHTAQLARPDPSGRPCANVMPQKTDPMNFVITSSYDALFRNIGTMNPQGNSITFSYNTQGLRSVVMNELGFEQISGLNAVKLPVIYQPGLMRRKLLQ